MRGLARFGALLFIAAGSGLPAAAAQTGEVIIMREVPTRSAVLPAPPGYAFAVDTAPDDVVRAHAPGPKLLNEDEVGAVIASTPLAAQDSTSLNPQLLTTTESASSDAASAIMGQGMNTFSSLGGQITDQVGSAVGNAMQSLTNALDTHR